MRKESAEEDYIKSFKYQYRLNGDEAHIPEGYKSLLNLAYLNGRLLWRNYLPFEQEEWEKLPENIRKAAGIQQVELLKKLGVLRALPVITVNGNSHH